MNVPNNIEQPFDSKTKIKGYMQRRKQTNTTGNSEMLI